MAAKEPERSPEERMLQWGYDNRLNVDMVYEMGTDNSDVYFVRMRPWENKSGKGDMYFGYGSTLLIACRMAVREYKEGEPIRLDYAYRPWKTERQRQPTASPFE